MKITTLCYIEHDGQYLMLHRIKKENDINEGKWIGVGGHAENGESPEECLLREVKEETGLTLTSYRFRALITFISDKQEPELMCLFTADEFSGKLITCNEGDLKWVDKTIVPTLPTWEGDAIFLKLLLKMKKISSHLSLYMKVNHWLIRSLRFISIILPQDYLQASAYLPPSFFPCYNKHSHIFPGI